jgi:hypothetical protein
MFVGIGRPRWFLIGRLAVDRTERLRRDPAPLSGLPTARELSDGGSGFTYIAERGMGHE